MDFEFHLKIRSRDYKLTIPKRWIRPIILVGVTILGIVVAYWGSKTIQQLILATLFGIVGVLILLRHMNLGFILLLLGGMFVSYSGPGGLNATVLSIGLLLVLWILDMLVVKRHFTFIRSPVLVPAIVFLVISVIAFGMGQIPWFAFARQAPLDAQLGGFAIFVLSAGALIMTAHLIQNERWLKIIVWTFIGFGTIFMLGRFLQISQIDRFYQQGFDSGSMFWTWLVALAFSQMVYNTKLKWPFRAALGLIVIITIYVAYFRANDWKSGWVPAVVAMGVILALRYKRLLILAVPIVVLGVGYATGELITTDEYSWGTRVDAWLIVLEISKVNPLLGLGFANYYWYTPLIPIRGYLISFNSHSQYVDLIAQVGILGLLAFLWIFIAAGISSWRLSGELPDGFGRAYAYGVLAGVAGSLLAGFLVDWILPFVYNIGLNGFRASILPWIFIGGLVSLEQISRSNQNHNLARLNE